MDQKDKKIRVITHGLRLGGFNPEHTHEGLEQIRSIATGMACRTATVPLIICGTGKRFLEIRDALLSAGIRADKILYSTLLGTQSGLDTGPGGSKLITLDHGVQIPYDTWFWAPVDYWAVLNELPNNTVVCAGGELIISLGGDPIKGRLFEVDPKARTIVDITDN